MKFEETKEKIFIFSRKKTDPDFFLKEYDQKN